MFYQYSKPKDFHQHLHNRLSAGIVKFGQILGFFWIKVTPDGKFFTFGTKSLLIWSKIIILIDFIFFLIYSPYYFYSTSDNDKYASNTISATVLSVADVLYSVLNIALYLILTFKQKSILRLVNHAAQLQHVVVRYKIKGCQKLINVLLYNLVFKIVIDITLLITTITLNIFHFISYKDYHFLFMLIWQSISFMGFLFTTTVFYISYGYGLFLNRKIFSNLSYKNSLIIALILQGIQKFMKKIHKLMELVALLLVSQAFISLVSEVSDSTLFSKNYNCFFLFNFFFC